MGVLVVYEQISMFDLLNLPDKQMDERRLFKQALERGSNICEFHKRLEQALPLEMSEFTKWLAKEFGIGGCCYTGFREWHDSMGIQVGTCSDDMKLYSWKMVAREYKKMYGFCDV